MWSSLIVKVAQSCPTLCDPMAYNSPRNSPGQNTGVGGLSLLQESTQPRSPTFQVNSLPAEPQGKPKNTEVGSLSLLQWILPTQELNQCPLHCRQIFYQLTLLNKLKLWKSSSVLEMEIRLFLMNDLVFLLIYIDLSSWHCSFFNVDFWKLFKRTFETVM